MKNLIKAVALAAGLSLVLMVSVSVPRLMAQPPPQQCGGAFVPTLNCIVAGIFNFQNGVQLGGSNFHTATVTLSNAQFIALTTTPINVIPLCSVASVPYCIPANFVAVPLYGVVTFNEFATYGGGSDLKLFYTSRGAGNAASGTITFAGLFDTGASNNEVFTGVIAGPEPGKTARSVAIQATAQTAITSGDGRNTVRVDVTYSLYPTGTLN